MLFETLGLRPQAGVNHKRGKSEAVTHEALKKMASRPTKKKTELVGEGEEVEVDEGEELTESDLSNIYKKWAFSCDAPWSNLTDKSAQGLNTTIRRWARWSLTTVSL